MRFAVDSSDDAPCYVDPAAAHAAHARRRALLTHLGARATPGYHGAKPHVGPLSEGCQLCAEGRWSCLFLNGVCEARCYFCPGYREAVGAPPHAERMVFSRAGDYAEYVARLGYGGASFSGGEPFGTFELMLEHLRALRAAAPDLYIWAYTNGRPATPERLDAAAAEGLDEVRFDIAAWGYDTAPVERALGRVRVVTVEIPAVPEDRDRLRKALVRLAALGVSHVHLHQLMLLGDNGPRLLKRRYALTRTNPPTVVDSELAALDALAFVADEDLPLAIQYCGSAYKDRWQARVDDLRGATVALDPREALTEAGCVRQVLDPSGALVDARAAAERPADAPLTVRYFRAVLGHGLDPSANFASVEPGEGYAEVTLPGGMTIGVRRVPVSADLPVSAGVVAALVAGIVPGHLAPFERIPEGLPDYR